MFDRLRRFLNGEVTCIRCGRRYQQHGFGYGYCICPRCYNNERIFIYLDGAYWLNRVVFKTVRSGAVALWMEA